MHAFGVEDGPLQDLRASQLVYHELTCFQIDGGVEADFFSVKQL
jgi:hypothetical protein